MAPYESQRLRKHDCQHWIFLHKKAPQAQRNNQYSYTELFPCVCGAQYLPHTRLRYRPCRWCLHSVFIHQIASIKEANHLRLPWQLDLYNIAYCPPTENALRILLEPDYPRAAARRQSDVLHNKLFVIIYQIVSQEKLVAPLTPDYNVSLVLPSFLHLDAFFLL